ncbi:hypothetical protein A0H81_04383 [Grifola frondosa]|uniref:Transcription factor domain-containing protein n=1 Tax=Grifola frondosa TaxID=5627 RepID=A0A1C7MFK6_GRIFR|nr:hypothetical protein A0H81_04383 [Grifola frondosa]
MDRPSAQMQTPEMQMRSADDTDSIEVGIRRMFSCPFSCSRTIISKGSITGSGKEQDCEYEDNIQRSLTEALLFRAHELEQRLAFYEGLDLEASAYGLSGSNSTLGLMAPTPHQHLLPNTNSTHLDMQHTGTFSTEAAELPLSTWLCPSPALDVHLMADLTAPNELAEFRLLFLKHHAQLGLRLPPHKIKAVLAGDLTGTSIHPVMVYLSQAMGIYLWQDQRRTKVCAANESVQLQALFEALGTGPDYVTQIEVHCLLAIYLLLKREMIEGREQLVSAAEVAMRRGFQFMLNYINPVWPSHEVTPSWQDEEYISALSELFYLDQCATIVFEYPQLLSAEFEQQFKTLHTRKISARWTNILLDQGAGNIEPSSAQSQWYAEYWLLLEEVSQHVANLSPSMLKLIFQHEREAANGFKLSMIISLTASAELHRLLPHHHTESRQKCLDVVLEIVGITKGFTDEDYILLDPILGVCWTMVAKILHQESKDPLDRASGIHWGTALSIIASTAIKLGRSLPFMEGPVAAISSAIQEVGITSID